MSGAVVKPRRRSSRRQVIFLGILGLLALVVVLLWFADPSHRSAGPSRIDWPAAAKP
jgi:hypothetical protein